MHPSSPGESLEDVELFESETVVARGYRTVLWRIRLRDAWVSVTQWPEVRVESLESGPGTVWHRRIELRAPRGTALERVISQPTPERRREPLEYLSRPPSGAARRVRRAAYLVGPAGRLVARRREP